MVMKSYVDEGVDYADLVVELLVSLKKFMKFKELETLLGISTPTLWRYIHGDIKPSQDRAKTMLSRLLSIDVIELLLSRVLKIMDSDIVSLYPIVYNVDILTFASIDAMIWGKDRRFTALVTVEVDGIPLATMIAKRLGLKMAVVKKKKEVGFSKFIELSYVTSMPPEIVTLYLPEGVLEPDDRVLIVDDLVRSGKTTSALCELVKKCGARPEGFYALIAIGDTWRRAVEQCVSGNYKILYSVKSSS
jgi:adenine/guanine phosphoribosyltransferase-like PRPP-binding protein/predicted DNA-binding transcriptional regulator AlpA